MEAVISPRTEPERTTEPERAPVPARWILPALDEAAIAQLARTAGLHLPAARILWSRGVREPAAAQDFLHPSLDHLRDPYLLAGMDAAVPRILRAVREQERVLIYGDYDVDGTSSVVMLTKVLQLLGTPVDWIVPHRMQEGYGMRTERVDEALANGVKLIISVDTGIRAGDVVRYAAERGIDVIITDHHLPEQGELPPALAVLNPNRPDCPYPDKNLCGAGVTFKLVQALLSASGLEPRRTNALINSFLKLAAIATVADVVPLSGENRAIVKLGLEGFDKVRNPGLRALLEVAGFKPGECPSATQVAFRLAPRINAAGRMSDAGAVIRMFLTEDEALAKGLAAELHAHNSERQETERAILDRIIAECDHVPVTDRDAVLVFSGPGWHKGVVGIVASRMVERYHRPVFVLGEEDGHATGSGRSIAQFHLLAALETMPELFERFGGHRQAAGLTLSVDRIADFRERLNTYAHRLLTPEDFRPAVEPEAELRLPELSDSSAGEILSLAPFGCGNPAPLFYIRAAEVANAPVPFGQRGEHVRFNVRQGSGQVQVKAWRMGELAAELQRGSKVDLAVTVDEDTYSRDRGYAAWAVTLRHIRTV